jgi:hypothetical protein
MSEHFDRKLRSYLDRAAARTDLQSLLKLGRQKGKR